MIALRSRRIICHQCKSLTQMIEISSLYFNELQENFISYLLPYTDLGGVYFIIESSNASSLFLLYFSIIYLHLDDYEFCQQLSKKGEIVGAMIGPLWFGVC